MEKHEPLAKRLGARGKRMTKFCSELIVPGMRLKEVHATCRKSQITSNYEEWRMVSQWLVNGC